MSILLDNLSAKAGMFAWLRDTADRFVLPFITVAQRAMLQRHVERMEHSKERTRLSARSHKMSRARA